MENTAFGFDSRFCFVQQLIVIRVYWLTILVYQEVRSYWRSTRCPVDHGETGHGEAFDRVSPKIIWHALRHLVLKELMNSIKVLYHDPKLKYEVWRHMKTASCLRWRKCPLTTLLCFYYEHCHKRYLTSSTLYTTQYR